MEIIGGRFQLVEQIGVGGMGKVFRAVDTQTRETVAVKLLKPNAVADDPVLLERFVREAEALRQLNHPNIVKVLGNDHKSDQQYIVLEYVASGSLHDLLRQGNPLSIQRILEIALDLSDALARAHRLQIIHRDIKPANILIADDGTPRLTDFGVAHLGKLERITGNRSTIGTLDYLPPEAFKGAFFDNRADIWAFGVTLFEMIAGVRPFVGDTIPALVMSIIQHRPPDLEALRADCPVGLVDLVYRMLEKDANARIPSIRLVGAELESLISERQATPKNALNDEPLSLVPNLSPISPTPTGNKYRHNLPAQTTAFVGRENELKELNRLLEDADMRLLTVLAPGGMGKTRLVLQVAEHQLPRFPNGVFFISLAGLSSVDSIIPTIAETVNFQFFPGGASNQQLLDYFRNKIILLILDNFEHLLEAGSIVADILAAAPHVKIITTSRERLNLSGETIYRLGGMDISDWETPENALEHSAAQLFLQSAQRIQPGYTLAQTDVPHISHICRAVEGMPLGIILAASWLDVLSPPEIATEIGKGLDFLETSTRDFPTRHRSIRALFDHSWNLLNESEKGVFQKLSVFRGGFTRNAAQRIAEASLGDLAALVSKSLIRRDARTGRYDVHDLLRQYAGEKLDLANQSELARGLHLSYFADAMHGWGRALRTRVQQQTAAKIEDDLDNLRAAFQYCIAQENIDLMGDLAEIWFFYANRGYGLEAEKLFDIAIQKFEHHESRALGMLLTAQADFYERSGRNFEEIALYLEKGLDLLRRFGKPLDTIPGVIYLANIKEFLKKITLDENILVLESALAVGETYKDRWAISEALYALSGTKLIQHRYEEAEMYLKKSLATKEINGDEWGQPLVLIRLAELTVLKADYIEAKRFFNQALHIARKLHIQLSILSSLHGLGEVELIEGNFPEAKTFFLEHLRVSEEIGMTMWSNDYHFGRLAYRTGDYPEAFRYLIDALKQLKKDNNIQFVRYLLVNLAVLLYLQSRKEQAVSLFVLSENYAVIREDNKQLAREFLERSKSELPVDKFAAASEHGKSLDLETVVAELLTEFGGT